MNALAVMWEADAAGVTYREAEGARYADLPRVDVFRLRFGAETIFETAGHGARLIFRRDIGVPRHDVRFKVGWLPGPAFVIDPEALDTDRVGVWIADAFHADPCACDPPHPPGAFYPPTIREGNVA